MQRNLHGGIQRRKRHYLEAYKEKREFLSLSTGKDDRGNKVGLYNNSYAAVTLF